MSDGLRVTGHLQVLTLDEDDGVPAADATTAPRRWIRRRAPWLVVAAVLATLALVGAQSVLDARERDRLAYLAAVPGILQPLPERVGALWRWAPTDSTVLVADDATGRWSIGTSYRTGRVELRGTDPRTGALLWTTPFPIDDALPAEARGSFPSVWVRCATLSAAPRAREVCAADLAGPAQVVSTPLMVLDPADGTVLARQVLPPGTLWTVGSGHLVVATPVFDDDTHTHWEVRAIDPVTGALAWQDRTHALLATGAVQVGFLTIDPQATLSSDPDRILLAGDGRAWLWTPDGTPLGTELVGTDGSTELGRSGTLVWTPFQSLADPAGVLVTQRGRHVTADATQATVAVDDGSAPDVVLLRTDPRGATLVARDARSGKELWRAEGSTGAVLVLDGAVVGAGSSSVVSRDARTGDARWRARLAASPLFLGANPLHVVVLTDDLRLRTLDLGDGHEVVAADVGSQLDSGEGVVADAQEHGGRLVVTFRDGSRLALG